MKFLVVIGFRLGDPLVVVIVWVFRWDQGSIVVSDMVSHVLRSMQ